MTQLELFPKTKQQKAEEIRKEIEKKRQQYKRKKAIRGVRLTDG